MIRVKADFFIYLFILILLSSCGGEKDAFVSIEYWTHEDSSRRALEERLIEEFEKENPDIDVVRTEYGSAELLDMITASFAAGKGPDLFNLPSEEISDLLYSGRLSEINSAALGYDSENALSEAYIPGAFDAVTLDSGIYGVPLEYTIWCLYVNKVRLAEAGLEGRAPETWEELADISKALTVRDGGVLLRRGFDFRYPYYLAFFVPIVRQLGGDVFSPDGDIIYNENAWEKALQFMQDWGPLGDNLGSPTYRNARTLFNSADIAMCLSGLYQESRLREQNPELFSSEEWFVAPFPVFRDSVSNEAASHYYHYFLVNGSSDTNTKNAAWKLAGYFTAHAEEYLDEIGLVMPLKSIMDSEALLDKPFADVFLSDLERSQPVYAGPHASEIQSLIGEAVESVMLYSVPPEKAVQALRSSISDLLEN